MAKVTFKEFLDGLDEEVAKEGPERQAELAAFSRYYQQVGDDIAELRKQRGMSQTRLAELSGVRQPEISNIERGKTSPTTKTASRLGAVLGAQLRMVATEALRPAAFALKQKHSKTKGRPVVFELSKNGTVVLRPGSLKDAVKSVAKKTKASKTPLSDARKFAKSAVSKATKKLAKTTSRPRTGKAARA